MLGEDELRHDRVYPIAFHDGKRWGGLESAPDFSPAFSPRLLEQSGVEPGYAIADTRSESTRALVRGEEFQLAHTRRQIRRDIHCQGNDPKRRIFIEFAEKVAGLPRAERELAPAKVPGAASQRTAIWVSRRKRGFTSAFLRAPAALPKVPTYRRQAGRRRSSLFRPRRLRETSMRTAAEALRFELGYADDPMLHYFRLEECRALDSILNGDKTLPLSFWF